ncbi:hypothetical protein PRUPE_4G202400 [Prunus persica]|uniref:Uncharacterized protein n=1 Tax=Prunus persica TaxID=3760 RepID=A0A251PNG7_PRUPE|nr:hypothetical protein PRUPE_4G202400 [Prunus persica]
MVFLSREGNQISFFYCRASDILVLQGNPGGFFSLGNQMVEIIPAAVLFFFQKFQAKQSEPGILKTFQKQWPKFTVWM